MKVKVPVFDQEQDPLCQLMGLISEDDKRRANNLLRMITTSNLHSYKLHYFAKESHTVHSVMKECAKLWDTTVAEMKSPSRKTKNIMARAFMYKYLVIECGLSYGVVGGYVGRDHSTVLNGLNMIEEQIKVGGRARLRYNKLTEVMRSRKGEITIDGLEKDLSLAESNQHQNQ